MDTRHRAPRILIVGGGYVGMYTALGLQRRLRPGEATITVIDPLSYMTYQPFLPEAAAGSLEPRHVVVPLRRVLPKAEVLTGRVTRINHATKTAWVLPLEGAEFAISYDVLVMAPGSVARTLPIPGLAETGIGFKTVSEAIYLRNHVISRLDIAATTSDADIKRRALTFLVVGGGYAGIECLAELEDMARDALRCYPNLTPRDMRWVLVEATQRILPEVSEALGTYTAQQLRARDIEVRLQTRVDSLVGGHAVLDDGTEFDTDTVVWTAGVKAHPLLAQTDLPLDEKGRVKATEYLAVAGVDDAWAAGDSAAVPDLTRPGEFTGPSAQHAVRQARRLAGNIIATLRGQPLKPYRHAYAGSVASLGLHKGVAEVYGVKLRDLPAWWMHRTYHLSRVPTLNRKVRVVTDWTIALFFRREVVSLGSLMRPREEWERVTEPTRTESGAADVTTIAVTVLGHDGPGIIAGVTEVLADLGGNIEDSTMTLLRGHFAMTLIVNVDRQPAEIEAALVSVAEPRGLVVSARTLPPEDVLAAGGTHHLLTVHGGDRPGIVSAVTELLAARGGNITDLTTRLTGDLYVLIAEVDLPEGADVDALSRELADVAGRLGIDATLRAAEADLL